MEFNKKSFIVTFHAALVAKGVLELEEVSEGNNLRNLVGEIIDEINYEKKEIIGDGPYNQSPYNQSGSGSIFRGAEEWYTGGSYNSSEEEIDPIDEEHIVDDSVEDSEVQGIGRATEVEPQEEDPENPSTAQGGSLPNQ